jgi:hypothetical protein
MKNMSSASFSIGWLTRRGMAVALALFMASSALAMAPDGLGDLTEEQVLRLARESENKEMISRELLEQSRLAIATRLQEIGTSHSIRLLRAYRFDPPQVKEEAVLHRRPEMVVLYPYDLAAQQAMEAIELRTEEDALLSEVKGNGLRALEETLNTEKPLHLKAVAGVAAKLSLKEREELAEKLEKRGVLTREEAMLYADLARQLRRVPPAEFFQELHQDAALQILQSANGWEEPKLEEVRQLALERDDLQSSAELLTAGVEGAPANASQAAAAARDRSPRMTKRLFATLKNGDSTEEAKKHAALGLMLQQTEESRAALRDALARELLPASIRADVEGWLGE